MIIDTHTHLYFPEEYADDAAGAVQRAIDAGVGAMIFPNVNRESVEPMNRLHDEFPDRTFTAIGLHPTEVTDEPVDEQLDFVADQLATGRHIAIGEAGIDLYWDATHRDRQMQVFERQMQWAAERDLPVIIHCRNGLPEAMEVIEGLDRAPQAVFHSFSGTTDDVEAIRRHGDFYFGINGIVTFKNSKLREVLPAIGLERLLLETDAPYLSPTPLRGRRNESAFMVHTAQHIAQYMGIPFDQLAAQTTANAIALFNLPDSLTTL